MVQSILSLRCDMDCFVARAPRNDVDGVPVRRPGRRMRERGPSMLPRAHIPEKESRDLSLLDFLAALGNAVAAVMPVDVFERLVAGVAHAAMDLHGTVG